MKYLEHLTAVIQEFQRANEMYNKIGFNKQYDYSIFNEAIVVLNSGEAFTKDQLVRWYQAFIDLEIIYTSMQSYLFLDEYPDYNIHFALWGLSFDEYESLDEYQKEQLSETYGPVLIDMSNETVTLEDGMSHIGFILNGYRVKKAI